MIFMCALALSAPGSSMRASQCSTSATIILDALRHQQPGLAVEQLKAQWSGRDLSTHTDDRHNNLMHTAITAMINQKNHVPYYPAFQQACIPLLRHLAHSGVAINELNDDRKAPHFLVYADEQGRQAPSDFVNFLESELGAHPTYSSLEPELRACKRFLSRAVCCFSKKKRA